MSGLEAKLDMELGEVIKKSGDRRGKRGGGGGGGSGGNGGGGGGGRDRGNSGRGPRRGGSGGGRSNNNNNNNNNNNGRRPGGGPQKRTNTTGRIARETGAPYSKGDPDNAWSHDLYDTNGSQGDVALSASRGGGAGRRGVRGNNSRAQRTATEVGRKIVITNLAFGVSENDIKELFQSIGPITRAKVKYDKQGRSRGEAIVVFENRDDVARAIEEYDGVLFDKQAMYINIAKPSLLGGGGGGNGGGGGGGRGVTARTANFTIRQGAAGDRVIIRN
eukprot:TRINITY_DN2839_c1_g3_i1.p1 TRINITY_DN2839_c1_g3~~TRINITY_DN2839_c1_g3_i1.p1  ORF type:complete len:275 (+),score=75.71 TRINITY_DN2839_c1_g3_i1:89-913(+)